MRFDRHRSGRALASPGARTCRPFDAKDEGLAMSSYHDGHRQLQDIFDSRRVADRLEQHTYRSALNDGDRAFVESADMFFLATADDAGQPDCSFKGGDPGFVRVISPNE